MQAYFKIQNSKYFVIYVLLLLFTPLTIVAQISFSRNPCNQRSPRIVGGFEANKHEFPFIVSLTKRGGHFCGATIINENWILTAGHCICNGLNKFMKPTQMQGILGLHSITNFINRTQEESLQLNPVQINFKTIIPHPQYICESVKNDIALLELLQPIQFSTNIQPSCLMLDSSNEIPENTLATVSGWGWTDENRETGQRADILRKASVKVWNNQDCEKSYRLNGKRNSFLTDTQMCAGFEQGGVDSCWADSGGPLISKEQVLIGVVSTGVGCARPGLPGIYTRVSKYIQWMQSVIINN